MMMGGARKPMHEIVFGKYDTDGGGTVSVDEFRSMVYDMGHSLSEEELAIAITQLDSNGDGSIDLAEFKQWWKTDDRFSYLQLDEEQLTIVKSLTDLYQYYDVEKVGNLSKEQFEALYKHCADNGYALAEFGSCMEQVDKSGDGLINFNEFLHWMIDMGVLKIEGIQPIKTLMA